MKYLPPLKIKKKRGQEPKNSGGLRTSGKGIETDSPSKASRRKYSSANTYIINC